ncbi:CotD family spore coat protein [Halobacillus campisalis]|uniref:CotD family spore coat protein n=1 Tax=Halobacillus campisalis TaxID=435909 RepID=A0ABW2K0Q0_9BACI|nr:CotD family spore coat protein [Halobacillus campisalis]
MFEKQQYDRNNSNWPYGQNDTMVQGVQQGDDDNGQQQGQQQGPQNMEGGYPQVAPFIQNPPRVMPAQYAPVRQLPQRVNSEVIIPVVHPSHTTQYNHTHYKYVHSFPHTQSVVNSYSCEDVCAPPSQVMGMGMGKHQRRF